MTDTTVSGWWPYIVAEQKAAHAGQKWVLKEAVEWELYLESFRYAMKMNHAQAWCLAPWLNDGKLADGSIPECRLPHLARLKEARWRVENAENLAAECFLERRWREEVSTLPPAEWSEETIQNELYSIEKENDWNSARIEKWGVANAFSKKNGGRMRREWAGNVPWTCRYTLHMALHTTKMRAMASAPASST